MTEKVQLKDGTSVEDRRLDRVVEFDERSRNFPICSGPVQLKKPRSYTWRCRSWLNQGHEGSCVGHAVAHELAARPSEVSTMTHKYAKEDIYWEAQKIDYWKGGSYPDARPFYEGTSVLAGVKIAHNLGWFDSYRWAFGLHDLKLGVGYNGPAVLGIKWYEGMYYPDSQGFIHPTGRPVGGHAILCNAISVKHKRFTLHNSWGKSWGMDGECYISFRNMNKLLRERGEAVFFLKRHRKAEVKK